jgi:DHA2 family methylenomycin A resistance protein-like MFS transporter
VTTDLVKFPSLRDTSQALGLGQGLPSAARALPTLCPALFMVILDTTIVNVALPAVGASLHSTVTGLQWVVDGYTLVFAALLLACGSACDRLGGRTVFVVGLATFTSGSALCAIAPSLSLLVGARLVQGMGAAMLLPASLAVLAASFPDPRAKARAIGIWAAVGGAAMAVGPVVGGALVDIAGWRSIFLVNLPTGAVALVMAFRHLAETPRRAKRFDLVGQSLAAAALALLTLALVEAGSLGWTSPIVLGPGGVALGLGVGFGLYESRAKNPMLPGRLLASPNFAASNVVGLVLNFGIYGQLFVLSLYFQRARGYSPLATGVALLPFALMTVAGPIAVGRLTARVGPRRPMIVGQLLAAAGSAVLAIAGAHSAYVWMVGGLVALGIGMALTMPSMTTAVVQSAPRELAGVASGVLNTARQVGGAIGVALLGSLVADRHQFVPGMHVGLVIVACAFAAGAWIAYRHVGSAERGTTGRGGAR